MAQQITLFGIHNCDTVKKAQKWLESEQIPFSFHDFRKDGFPKKAVRDWLQQVDAKELVNRRSTSWRNLSDNEKSQIENGGIIPLLEANPTLIKRPVTVVNGTVSLGFSDKLYQSLFNCI